MQDTKTTPKNTLPITWIVVSILTMILLGAGMILMREIFSLQKASIAAPSSIEIPAVSVYNNACTLDGNICKAPFYRRFFSVFFRKEATI